VTLRAKPTCRPESYNVVVGDDDRMRVFEGTRPIAETSVFLDDEPIARAFWTSLEPALADLGDIVVAIYTADRLCPRYQKYGKDLRDWRRQLQLNIRVRNPDLWQNQIGNLSQLLEFLTDDDWKIVFSRKKSSPRRAELQATLFPEFPPATAAVALFSGGLDSLSGLVAQLQDSPAHIVTYSARTNARIGGFQRSSLEALKQAFPDRITPVSIAFGLRDRGSRGFDREDRSQRTRGFAFQVFGAITSLAGGLNELRVYENGIGALNLPYTGSQLGSQCTRASHPFTLALISKFITAAIGRSFRISLPFLWNTKAELCTRLSDAGLPQLAVTTRSCDHFPQRVKGKDQCGRCTSCILRRQSLYCSGLSTYDSSDNYVCNILDVQSITQRNRLHLNAMNAQADQLTKLLGEDSSANAVFLQYPLMMRSMLMLKRDGVDDADSRLVDLYRRYCAEWSLFERMATQRSGRIAVGITA
jgi:queuosine biosynthesis protein QueC